MNDASAIRGVDTSLGQMGLCRECGKVCPEGPDACLGYIPGVSHACCGHGGACEPYVTLGGFPDQDAATIPAFVVLRGDSATRFFELVRDHGEWSSADGEVAEREVGIGGDE